MNSKLLVACLGFSYALSAVAAPNLIINGNMGDDAKFAAECRTDGDSTGKLSLYTEDLTWNKCGKLEVVAIKKSAQGSDVINANAWIGLNDKGLLPGFEVKPNTTYSFSIDLRGTPKWVRVAARTWSENDLWKGSELRLTTVSFTRIAEGWQTFTGTFKTGPKDVRTALCVQMWSDSQYPKAYQYKVGDTVWFDNVSVTSRQGDIEAFAAKCKTPFVVAPVPTTADMRIPFVPEELFNAPREIVLRAAVNERASLPIAIANLTGEIAEYRVSLETDDPQYGLNKYDGAFGLVGFPPNQITARKAIRVKDRDPYAGKLRLDPLVKMDEGMTLSVPSLEGGLVWYEIDTTNVQPGTYHGRLRVIPLSDPASFEREGDFLDVRYKGPMRDIPVRLVVLPIELDPEPVFPADLSVAGISPSLFNETLKLGMRYYLLSPWSLTFPELPDGTLADTYRAEPWEGGDLVKLIRENLAWAHAAKTRIRFVFKYSAWTTFLSLYNLKSNPEKAAKLWPLWLKRVEEFMAKQGLSHDDWRVQLWDEPSFQNKEELLIALKAAKKAVPKMQFYVTFLGGNNPLGVKELREIEPYLDAYSFHDIVYLRNPGYADYLAELVKKGKLVAHYTCSTMMTEDLDREFRQNAWLCVRFGLNEQGLYHALDCSGGYGVRNWKVTQMGGLLYRSYENYLPSIRAMAFRQGNEDVKYIRLLRRLSKGDVETERFIREAVLRVTENPVGGDRYLADKVRNEIIDRILKASHAVNPQP